MSLSIVKSRQNVPVGGGSQPAKVGGMLHVDTSTDSTTAVTTEEILKSYTLPANSLAKDGQGLRIKAWGKLAANGNTKNIRVKLGAYAELLVTTANDKTWYVEAIIFRTGVGTQKRVQQQGVDGSAPEYPDATTHLADETTDLAITVTGQNGTASAGDIVNEGLMVEALNAA